MFDLKAPLLPAALQAAHILGMKLPKLTWWRTLGKGLYFDHIYLHWTAGAWGCTDGAYNAEIDLQGEPKRWVMLITHPPLDNAVQITNGPYAAHTFGRNSHAFGISITGMRGATTNDFGDQAVQVGQLEYLCAATGAIAMQYGIDIAGKVRNEYNVMTHAEAAIADGYFGERWDLARLVASPSPLTPAEAVATASLLRQRSRAYKLALLRYA